LNLQQLYYFRAVAEFEHYTLAAGRLMVSPSSLSHAISDLENELGTPLFEPKGRGIRLTEYGKLYLSYVTKALDMLEQGNAHLRSTVDPEKATIAICYISSLQPFLPHLISKFLAETGNKKINFQFYTGSPKMIEDGLDSGSYHIAFSSRQGHDRYDSHDLGPHELVALVPIHHPLAEQEHVSVAQLGREKLITYVQAVGNTRAQIDAMFENAGCSPEIVFESTLDTYIVSAVAANFGIALIPRPLTTPSYGVKVLSISDEAPPRNTWVLRRKSRFTAPAEQKFWEFIVQNDHLLQELLDMQREENNKQQ